MTILNNSVVRRLKKFMFGIQATIGPAGTSKTRAMVLVIIAVCEQDQKVTIAADANNAPDNTANELYKRYPAEERDKKKFLRLETTSTDLYTLRMVKDYDKLGEMKPEDRLQLREEKSVPDDNEFVSRNHPFCCQKDDKDRSQKAIWQNDASYTAETLKTRYARGQH